MITTLRNKKTFFIPIVCLFISAVFSVIVYAQAKSYRIGSDDILTLTIYAGGEVQQQVDLTVSGQGTINAPFIGPIKAEGLTPSSLEALIVKPLAQDFFVDPQVNISIKEYHHLSYYISGAVSKPGLYESSSEITVFELIAKASGVLPARGNVAFIQRSKKSGDSGKEAMNVKDIVSMEGTIKVDLHALLDKGDMRHNPVLQPGDVVYIPFEKSMDLAESKIYVGGEVKKPGVYDYQTGLTALNACLMAGGFGEFAAPNRARIIRKKGNEQEILKINLNDVKSGKIPDIVLKPGDLIDVPETWL